MVWAGRRGTGGGEEVVPLVKDARAEAVDTLDIDLLRLLCEMRPPTTPLITAKVGDDSACRGVTAMVGEEGDPMKIVVMTGILWKWYAGTLRLDNLLVASTADFDVAVTDVGR